MTLVKNAASSLPSLHPETPTGGPQNEAARYEQMSLKLSWGVERTFSSCSLKTAASGSETRRHWMSEGESSP